MNRSAAWALARCRAVTVGACLGLTGCVATPPAPFTQPVVLLGEVHDNASQHALRLRAFAAWLDSGARPALALEQIDRQHQPALDALLAQTPRPDADAVIALAGGKAGTDSGSGGWDWRFYRPYIALALQHGLPIVAANVSRDEARLVMRGGLAASGFDADVPPAVLAALAGDIEASHCGMVDAATAARMALAQVARDQFMARVLSTHAAGGVLLLAGNGHVRTDIGAPRWLAPAVRARSEAVGYLEVGDDSATAYDRVVFTPRQQRDDPCAGVRPPQQAAPVPR